MKLSYKLGTLLFVIIFLLQGLLSFFLYMTVVNNRVEEEVERLLIRGSTYSELLSNEYNEKTMQLISNLEKKQDTKVVLSDGTNFRALGEMDTVSQGMLNQIREGKNIISSKSMVMEKDWKQGDFLCVVSPIIKQRQVVGYVYLFEGTNYIQSLIKKIGISFLGMTTVSFFVTVGAVYYLTITLTKPILRMKEKTKLLMKKEVTVNSYKYRDELGELDSLIEKLTAELTELKNQRSEFLASISHELRTPLTYIQGYINILYKRLSKDEQQRKYLGIVKEETENLTKLIENLFLLAKLDKNEFEIEKKTVHLPSLIKKVTEKVSLVPNYKKNITFTNCSSDGWIAIDPIRIEQVVMNIINNSLRYTNEHGEIHLSILENENTLEVIVEDNGMGMEQEELNKIFQPFYRIDQSRNRVLGGYGLGLSIVKEIIDKHNGEIKILSEKEKGTKVKIILPKGSSS